MVSYFRIRKLQDKAPNPLSIPIVNAIIFLAPISGFDQVLAEDRSVNRLEDSVLLWKMICANKLLANVELVLFLNKCDILEKKLRAGVKLAKYVKSYGGRGNESETVQKCEFLSLPVRFPPSWFF